MYMIEAEKMPVDYKVIDLMKGEHMSKENLAENPKHSIPWYSEDKFALNGSEAIMKYLGSKHKSKYYPDDLKKRAKIDEMMNWAQNVVYRGGPYQHIYMHLGWGLETACKYDATRTDEQFKLCDTFLSKSAYICGDEMTLADFQLYSVFAQYKWVQNGKKWEELRKTFDFIKELEKYPALKKWYTGMDSLECVKAVHALGLDGFCGYMASLEITPPHPPAQPETPID